jgi:hypothetical protein
VCEGEWCVVGIALRGGWLLGTHRWPVGLIDDFHIEGVGLMHRGGVCACVGVEEEDKDNKIHI